MAQNQLDPVIEGGEQILTPTSAPPLPSNPINTFEGNNCPTYREPYATRDQIEKHVLKGNNQPPVTNVYKTELTQVYRQDVSQGDINRLIRLSIDQKPIPAELQHAAEALVNNNLAFFDKYGKIHIKTKVSESDIRSADARQAYVVRLVVRGLRDTVSKDHKRIGDLENRATALEDRVGAHDKKIKGHDWWMVLITLVAIAALALGLWRLYRRRVGGVSGH